MRVVTRWNLALAVTVAVALAPTPRWAWAQPPPGPTAGTAAPMEMEHPPTPFYREGTFHVLLGLLAAGAGFVVYRLARSRRRGTAAPAGFVSEAVLVVDLVDSTRLATHYGSAVALRARNIVAERARAAAGSRGLTFWETTGDGCLMTFAAVARAVETAVALVGELERQPPDIPPAPPLAVRAGIGYGEILLDDGGQRHGAAINKAFRLLAVTAEAFTPVAGAPTPDSLPDRNRILLDEEAANELPAAEPPRRFVGFATLKGFPGLHRVYAVDPNAPAPAPGRKSERPADAPA